MLLHYKQNRNKDGHKIDEEEVITGVRNNQSGHYICITYHRSKNHGLLCFNR